MKVSVAELRVLDYHSLRFLENAMSIVVTKLLTVSTVSNFYTSIISDTI